MREMIERVAEAIWWRRQEAFHPTKTPWEAASDHNKFYYRDFARLVLDAIEDAGYVVVPTEPTEAMLQAGRECNPFGGTHENWTPGQIVASTCWRAMIAAALTPEPVSE